MKVTIDVDADIYRGIKVEAARTDRSVRDVVDEALAAWLEESEAKEDRERDFCPVVDPCARVPHG